MLSPGKMLPKIPWSTTTEYQSSMKKYFINKTVSLRKKKESRTSRFSEYPDDGFVSIVGKLHTSGG